MAALFMSDCRFQFVKIGEVIQCILTFFDIGVHVDIRDLNAGMSRNITGDGRTAVVINS